VSSSSPLRTTAEDLTSKLPLWKRDMSDRISALGGTLEVTSQPSAGVTITGRIPPEPRVHS
jgi:signal transduction histidine kinase